MSLKLPPKLQSPYTLADWKELEYKTDTKFLNAIKELNLALVDLKRTKPPTAAAFSAFTEQTAYLIKRLKLMLNDKDMPENIRENMIEPFYALLRQWQKGALKIEDILSEKEDDAAAVIQASGKTLQRNFENGQACERRYKMLAEQLIKSLSAVATLAAIVKKGKPSPDIARVYDKLVPDKTLKAFEDEHADIRATSDKLLKPRDIAAIRDTAVKSINRDLASQADTCAKQLATITKLDEAVGANIAKYATIAGPLRQDIETLLGIELKR